MRFQRKSRLSSEVSTSSLNDIMFMLLLFFLIVATMVNPSVVKLVLPKSDQKTNVVGKKLVTVTVDKNLNYTIDNVPVSKDMLEPTLQQKLAGLLDPSVVLRVDNSLTVQQVVDVIDIGAKLNVRMVLATQNR